MERPPLVLCPVCLNGNLYEVDMSRRCCRARFTAMLGKKARLEKYEWMKQARGPDYTKAHIQDVNEFRRMKQWQDAPPKQQPQPEVHAVEEAA